MHKEMLLDARSLDRQIAIPRTQDLAFAIGRLSDDVRVRDRRRVVQRSKGPCRERTRSRVDEEWSRERRVALEDDNRERWGKRSKG